MGSAPANIGRSNRHLQRLPGGCTTRMEHMQARAGNRRTAHNFGVCVLEPFLHLCPAPRRCSQNPCHCAAIHTHTYDPRVHQAITQSQLHKGRAGKPSRSHRRSGATGRARGALPARGRSQESECPPRAPHTRPPPRRPCPWGRGADGIPRGGKAHCEKTRNKSMAAFQASFNTGAWWGRGACARVCACR